MPLHNSMLIHTALSAEARPLIARLGLKKRSLNKSFELYENNDFSVLVSGVGGYAAAASIGAVLSAKEWKSRKSFVLNVGIAGATAQKEHASLQYVHKVIDRASDLEFYPDILLQHPGNSTILETHQKAVQNSDTLLCAEHICDMEAAAVFAAARMFTSTSRIQSFKVVSDFLDGRIPSKRFVSDLIEGHATTLVDWIKELIESTVYQQPLFSEEESQLLETLCTQARLTVSQRHIVYNEARRYKSHAHCLPAELHTLCSTPQSSLERKKLFKKLQTTFETE